MKKWHIAAGVAIAVLGTSVLFQYSGSDAPKGQIAKNVDGKIVYEDVQVASKANSRSVSAVSSGAASPAVMPPRVMAAPSYDKLVMAARIIQESADPDNAATFVGLMESRRNAKIQMDIAQYKAERAQYEADMANAEAKREKAKNGHILTENGNDMMQAQVNYQAEQLVEGEGRAEETVIRLAQYDDATNSMYIKVGDRWFSKVSEGQTIAGYVVGQVDRDLKCVPLTKGSETEVVCLN